MTLGTFFNPSGRLNRGQFLIAVVVLLVLGAGNSLLGLVEPGSAAAGLATSLGILLGLVLAYMWIAVWFKRLHDAGTTGWMSLLIILGWAILYVVMLIVVVFQVVPEFGQIDGSESSINEAVAIMESRVSEMTWTLVIADTALTAVYALLFNMLLGSDKEDNEYGPAA